MLRRKVTITDQPTIVDIDEALARISAGRGNAHCDATIDQLLAQRKQLTEAQQ